MSTFPRVVSAAHYTSAIATGTTAALLTVRWGTADFSPESMLGFGAGFAIFLLAGLNFFFGRAQRRLAVTLFVHLSNVAGVVFATLYYIIEGHWIAAVLAVLVTIESTLGLALGVLGIWRLTETPE